MILTWCDKDIKVREERMKQYDDEQSVRTLGIHMSPALNWDSQFQEVKIKIEESIRKLSNALMIVLLTHMYVNSYFMSKFYFGCGIMSTIDAQDSDLRKTCESH